jgi:hypothetical protein
MLHVCVAFSSVKAYFVDQLHSDAVDFFLKRMCGDF